MGYSPYPTPNGSRPSARVWLWVAVGITVMAIFFVGGCVAVFSSDADSENVSRSAAVDVAQSFGNEAANTIAAPSSSAALLPPQRATTGRVSVPIPDGSFTTFTVLSVETGIASVGDFVSQPAQGEFAILTVTVANTSSHPITFRTSQQQVRDGGGRVFDVDGSATVFENDALSWNNEINPGNQITARLVFDMPAEVEPSTVSLRASGGRPVTVALR
ncbi:DUF4352 domain-containing protein [Gordonia aquimaris]|uniref:DUF4352 domain-containing protein n=1 Tax=Gordonia aquimaris TaxID=2984863 RepID=A0A9X3D7K0_9ACTN|nr:DUF4352 domain-containing protein [Gordonia aquimaris]MCX2966353.1 DUF4352 domain-containing protein [Gordonia aquimaris]